MGLSTILTTLIITTSPDLCADVYADATGQPYTDALGQTWSRYCEWTGPNAPVLDLDVCCTISGDNAWCTLPDRNGRCSRGAKRHCKYGEKTTAGTVACYQPFPSTCDLGFCSDVLPPGGGAVEDLLCCWTSGWCSEIETVEHVIACGDTGGYTSYCFDGAQSADGTVECFD